VIETIVSFAEPPVVEVVAGVAFDGVDPELGPLLAAFWKEHLRSAFPVLEQQPPYSPPVEHFPLGGASSRLSLNLDTFLTPRIWAKSGDGDRVLQLQPGYFACNWRKVGAGGEYDRWPRRRSDFAHYFSLLSEFLATEGGGEPKVTQCEVTYVNHIRPGEPWADLSDFGNVFAISIKPAESYPLEQASIQAEYLMLDQGEPYGRVHVKVLPALDRIGKTPLYVLELTARGAPRSGGAAGALTFLDKGREAIDQLFVNLTTRAMHLEWGVQE